MTLYFHKINFMAINIPFMRRFTKCLGKNFFKYLGMMVAYKTKQISENLLEYQSLQNSEIYEIKYDHNKNYCCLSHEAVKNLLKPTLGPYKIRQGSKLRVKISRIYERYESIGRS